jgi:hypothetical protein
MLPNTPPLSRKQALELVDRGLLEGILPVLMEADISAEDAVDIPVATIDSKLGKSKLSFPHAQGNRDLAAGLYHLPSLSSLPQFPTCSVKTLVQRGSLTAQSDLRWGASCPLVISTWLRAT